MSKPERSLKKGLTLPEILVAVAVLGIFILLLFYVFRGGIWWSYRSQKLNEVQQTASILMDHLAWDIRGAYSFEECGPSSLKMKVYSKNGSEYAHEPALFTNNPSVSDVEYNYDSTKRIITRKFGNQTLKYSKIEDFKLQGYKVEQPDFPLIESDDLDKIVALGIKLWVKEEARVNDEDQEIELISLVYSKSKLLLNIFGANSPLYGYFSSLEDGSF